MTEKELVRAALRLVTKTHLAAAPLAKDTLEWAREHGDWLFGLKRKEAKALKWSGLKCALKDPVAPEAPCGALSLAARFSDLLGLTGGERTLAIVLMAARRAGRFLSIVSMLELRQFCVVTLIGVVAGYPAHDAERAVRGNTLVRLGLVRLKVGWRGRTEIGLGWSLCTLFDRMPVDDDGIVEAVVGDRHADGLGSDAFAHVDDRDYLTRLLQGARRERADGVNILIHGPPGTGKTELARCIAHAAGLALYGVAEGAVDNYEPDRSDRLAALDLGQSLLAKRDAALLFDEMEDLIGNAKSDGTSVTGRTGSKVFVNRLLESNKVPIIWTTNRIDNVDTAILRRMSHVLHLDYPRRKAALAMINRIGAEEGTTPSAGLVDLVENARETATVARTAARSARLAGEGDGGFRSAKSLVQGLSGQSLSHPAPPRVDLALYQSDPPVAGLIERLRDGGHLDVSLLLTGPPGTGKTALAHEFARQLDRPLMVKRASDLLSKWVGGTEGKIADAFAAAREDECVLLFDEADSLLFDRTTARASWEVGQVNEMLTWLDRHPLPVIAATNHEGRLDSATMRRFLYKLRLEPLRGEKAACAFVRFFDREAPASLAELHHLTPGDFSIVARQLRHEPDLDAEEIVRRLGEEVRCKHVSAEKIGF